MALRLVKDHVFQARGGGEDDRITAKEVWEQLVGEMTGQARRAPSTKTVKRWLDRWVSNGVLVEGKKKVVVGSDKPVPSYSLPSSSRALCLEECLLHLAPREPLVEQEKGTDNPEAPETDVRSSEPESPEPDRNGQQPNPDQDVRCNFPVPEGDLKEEGAKDIPTGTTCARAGEAVRPVLGQYIPVEGEWEAAFERSQPDPDSRLG